MTSPTISHSSEQGPPGSKRSLWVGRVLSALGVLLLLFDVYAKLTKVPEVVQGMGDIGFPESLVVTIGILLLISVAVYVFPPTAVLGAILLTGYLGGAVAANLRVHRPLFSDTLGPVYLALILWGGLYLRDPRLRALIPYTSYR